MNIHSIKAVLSDYSYVFMTIVLSTTSQIILKWQIKKIAAFPSSFSEKILYMIRMIITNYFVLFAYFICFIASICWLLALKKLSLNVAFPLLSLSFVTVCTASSIVFREPLKISQILGILFILVGSYLVNLAHASSTSPAS